MFIHLVTLMTTNKSTVKQERCVRTRDCDFRKYS